MRRAWIDDDLMLDCGLPQLFIKRLRNAHWDDLVGITEHTQDRVLDLPGPIKVCAVKIGEGSIKTDGAGQASVFRSGEKGERTTHTKANRECCTFAACVQAQIGQRCLGILEEVLWLALLQVRHEIEGIVADQMIDDPPIIVNRDCFDSDLGKAQCQLFIKWTQPTCIWKDGYLYLCPLLWMSDISCQAIAVCCGECNFFAARSSPRSGRVGWLCSVIVAHRF